MEKNLKKRTPQAEYQGTRVLPAILRRMRSASGGKTKKGKGEPSWELRGRQVTQARVSGGGDQEQRDIMTEEEDCPEDGGRKSNNKP